MHVFPVTAFLLILTGSSIVEALRGIQNDGNRCYKAATFQALANLPPIYQEAISKFPATKDRARQAAAAVIAQLRSPPGKNEKLLVLSDDFVPALKEDLKLPGRSPMEPGVSDDAQDFYTWLTDWGLPKEASDVFNTQVKLTKYYKGIPYREDTLDERVMRIYLSPKRKDRTLEEMIAGNNGVRLKAVIGKPEKASTELLKKLRDAGVKFGQQYGIREAYHLHNSPRILPIHIVKDWQKPLHAGLALNFSETMHAGGKKYTLVGAIMYPGGHYYAMTREAGTGAWYELNDSIVSKKSLQDLRNNANEIFMIFYARQDEYDSWVSDPKKFFPAWPAELSAYVAKLDKKEKGKTIPPKDGGAPDEVPPNKGGESKKAKKEGKGKENESPKGEPAKKPEKPAADATSFQAFWKNNREWVILVGVAVVMVALTLTAYTVASRRRRQQARF